MKKAEARKLFLQKRSEESLASIEEKSRAVAEVFFKSFPLAAIRTVHAFLPILHKKELDTSFIINRLMKEHGVTVAVSKTNFEDNSLQCLLFTEATILKENKWGIPEPEDGELVAEHTVDLVLVPLLAYDKNGNRVGYGKGFYDRLLCTCRKDVLKVGLSFYEPVEEIEDINEFDIPLDFCLTDKRVYEFKSV